MYNFTRFTQKLAETETWLEDELRSIQTGRATPAILDTVRVDSYGTKVKISQVAAISVEDAKTLRIAPWDASAITAIESALRDADLGVGLSVDEKGVRATFPELTAETREKYVKVARQKLEEARVSLRSERDEVWNDIQKRERDGEFGEDEKFRLKDEMEKLAGAAKQTLDRVAERKEQEIRG